MRHGISIATEALLKTFQYPITREGLLLSIGNNELFIGQPCSGFRSLITMVSAGLVYVFISKADFSKKVILASSIIPFALLGNLFRIIILCLITYYFGEAAGQGFFHNFSGIVMIVIITLGLMCLEYFLGKHKPNTSHIPPHGGGQREELSPAGGGAGGGKITHSWRGGVDEGDELVLNKGYRNKKVYITTALLLFTIIFCFASPGANTKKTKYVSQDILSQLEIPYKIKGWHGVDARQDWDLELEEKMNQFIEQSITREYTNTNGENIFFTMVDAGNFHNPRICANGAGFKIKDSADTEFHVALPAQAGSRILKARSFYTEKGNDGFLVIYWVCVDNNVVDWMEEKVKEIWFSLLDNSDRVSLMIRLDIPCKESSIDNALKLARGFVADFSQNIPIETATFVFGTN
ncbi:MAG: putative exosortase [Candidatus Brocadia fulgida]|uniref:Exosortase n=1 Tax=Candidatus Brocadia fulgida TaxID=380242 RepID=A0A0M2UST3_9BACT|nr:MAG: putative exosortase [Candidatus Brocadia fulgida]